MNIFLPTVAIAFALTCATSASAGLVSGNALTNNALTENAITSNAITANALTSNAITSNAFTANALTNNSVLIQAMSPTDTAPLPAAYEPIQLQVMSVRLPDGSVLTIAH